MNYVSSIIIIIRNFFTLIWDFSKLFFVCDKCIEKIKREEDYASICIIVSQHKAHVSVEL